jgi:hypothetical protein
VGTVIGGPTAREAPLAPQIAAPRIKELTAAEITNRACAGMTMNVLL